LGLKEQVTVVPDLTTFVIVGTVKGIAVIVVETPLTPKPLTA
jgi:hypothetical protein